MSWKKGNDRNNFARYRVKFDPCSLPTFDVLIFLFGSRFDVRVDDCDLRGISVRSNVSRSPA
jgi:hypothetical protein